MLKTIMPIYFGVDVRSTQRMLIEINFGREECLDASCIYALKYVYKAQGFLLWNVDYKKPKSRDLGQ